MSSRRQLDAPRPRLRTRVMKVVAATATTALLVGSFVAVGFAGTALSAQAVDDTTQTSDVTAPEAESPAPVAPVVPQSAPVVDDAAGGTDAYPTMEQVAAAIETDGTKIPLSGAVTPFPEGMGRAWIVQGAGSNSSVRNVINSPTGMTFADSTGTIGKMTLNALAFDQKNRILYAMRIYSGDAQMIRIGANSEYQVVPLKRQGGAPIGKDSWYSGTWGLNSAGAGVYYFRAQAGIQTIANPESNNVAYQHSVAGELPDTMDFSFKDGFLWAAMGLVAKPRMYRINVANPSSYVAESWPLAGVKGASPYGAQWFYGNGDLAISRNTLPGQSLQPYYQIQITNGETAQPSFAVYATTPGTSSDNNDGAAYMGLPVDLGVVKTSSELFIGGPTSSGPNIIQYTITVTNNEDPNGVPQRTSSGFQLTDKLPLKLKNPRVVQPASNSCELTPGTATVQGTYACAGGELAPGASIAYVIEGETEGIVKDECMRNDIRVKGFERDDNPANDTSFAEPCAGKKAPEGFLVSKAAVVAPQAGTTATSTVPGGTVNYGITVKNIDKNAYTVGRPASFIDDVSAVLDDADITLTAPVDPNLVFDPVAKTIRWSGPLALDEERTFRYSAKVKAPVTGNYSLDNVVSPGVSGDCVSAAACRTSTPVSSFVVTKKANKTAVHAGDTITYTVDVTNIGQVNYTDASFSDDLSKVTTNATFNNDAKLVPVAPQTAADGGAFSFDAGASRLDWVGALKIGEKKTFRYSATVKTGAAGKLTNTVKPTEVTGLCTTVAECTVTTPIGSYVSAKVVDKKSAKPGETVTYTVTMTNTGLVAYDKAINPAVFTDDMTDVLDDGKLVKNTVSATVTVGAGPATATDLPVFTGADPATNTPAQAIWSGSLPLNATVTVSYQVKINNLVKGNHVLRNGVTSPGCDTGICRPVETPIYDFTVDKTADKVSTATGDIVSYTLTVTNTGQVAYTNAVPAAWEDDLTGVLDDAVFNNDANASAGALNYTAPKLSWTGPLPLAGVVTITYTVTVKPTIDPASTAILENQVCWTVAVAGAPICDRVDVPIVSYKVEKVASKTVAKPGDKVLYTLTVTNTGDVQGGPASGFSAEITDALTNVFDDANLDPDYAITGGASFVAAGSGLPARIVWTGDLPLLPIAGNDNAHVITFQVIVKPIKNQTGNNLLVNAVCAGPSCVPPPVCTPTHQQNKLCAITNIQRSDVTKSADKTDAKPGDAVTYTVTVANTGTVDFTAADPATLFDNVSNVLDDATFDPATITIVGGNGVAPTYTAPTLSWSGALAVGQTVKISYVVVVKGAARGDNILRNAVCFDAALKECKPPVLVPVRAHEIVKTVDKPRAAPGETVNYTITVTNTGELDYTAANKVTWKDDLSDVLDDATFDYTTVQLSSVPAAGAVGATSYTKPTLSWSGTLAKGQTTTITFSVVVKATGSRGDSVLKNAVCWTATDCGGLLLTPVYDYTVDKSADKSTVAPGETVTYTITVTNTGADPYTLAKPATWSDSLAEVLDDATFDGTTQILSGGGTVTYVEPVLSWSGPLEVGTPVVITYSVTVPKPTLAGSDNVLTNVVCKTLANNCGPVIRIPVMEYDVAKTASPGAAQPGDVVTYTLTVTNTGEADYTTANPASITDSLSAVLDDATFNAGSITTKLNGVTVAPGQKAAYAAGELTWAGALPQGGVVVITYTVTVNKLVGAGDNMLTNFVCAGVCSPPPPVCLDGDTTCTNTPVLRYDYNKVPNRVTARVGEIVSYTITVTNTGEGDFTAADPISIKDIMTGVLDDAEYQGDATAVLGTIDDTTTPGTLLYTGALARGEVDTVTYSVKVLAANQGDRLLSNVVEDDNICPPGSNDPKCNPLVTIPEYTAKKVADRTETKPGETVNYTITVTNSGTVDFTVNTPVNFTDDLTAVLDDTSFISGSERASTGAVSYTEPTLAWTGALKAGKTATITYSVKVDDTVTGDHTLVNTVVTGSTPLCYDETNLDCQPPLPPCPVDSTNPDCTSTVLVRDFDIVKTADTQTAKSGDIVMYSITFTNTGQVAFTDAKPFTLKDDLSKVLDDATMNVGSITGGAKYDTPPVLTWSGPLAVGAEHTITYTVKVDLKAHISGDKKLINKVETPDGKCVVGSNDPACTTLVKLELIHVTKKADKLFTKAGDVVTYTITVKNVGTAPSPEASFTDDLTDVLKLADYNNDATKGASYVKPILSWTAPLAVGESATITYSVTVKATAVSGTMKNVVVTPPTLGNCDEGSTDPDCQVDVPVLPPLAETGMQLGGALLVALLTLGGGFALVSIRRRRVTGTR
ncbi:DUF7927 domain-containing protein [Glaciibacter psychrotolerans]|uniref:Putative repeat protein (TIGR01451 family) n=1 Tax=Glaciibacter psychrotolerans TaxID=670054 RepID=A0A7Z0J6L1_9MICO|nr:DUF11 domain-containing protein [Leifsonia psychrotolerans]NYJ20632.1 putative repeat protein (TIGR01451 family) [Leifsonia psychrotolerans]